MSERNLDLINRVAEQVADASHRYAFAYTRPGNIDVIRQVLETAIPLLDAARAEGGASVDHIPDAGKMVGGEVEGLAAELLRRADESRASIAKDDDWSSAMPDEVRDSLRADVETFERAADSLLSLSRLLQEAREEALRVWQTARAEALDEALDRAEIAERLLGEVVGAVRRVQRLTTANAHEHTRLIDIRDIAAEALSKVSEEGFSSSQGSVEGPGCVPAANRSHQPSAEGAVSPEGK